MDFFFFLGGGGVETVLEESMDYNIYRDYIANRRSFIYCSLATARAGVVSDAVSNSHRGVVNAAVNH